MKKFDYLEVKGSHKDLGKAIGLKFRKEIQNRVFDRQKEISNYSEFLKRSEPYYKVTKDCFPMLVEELEFMEHAAGVGVSDLFSINNREVYD